MSKIPKGTHLSGVWSAPPKSMYLDTQKCPAEPQSVNQTSPALGMSVVIFQSLSHAQLFMTPWTAAHQIPLSSTISQSLFKITSIELVMLPNHLILHCPLLFLPSIFPSISVFSNDPALCIRWTKYWSFSFNISPPCGMLHIKKESLHELLGWLQLVELLSL